MDYGSPLSVFTTTRLAFSLGNQYTPKPLPGGEKLRTEMPMESQGRACGQLTWL